ncbi:carbohydrate ABC transporter permease [Haloarcula sp. NS06]|uniref:ABC transporter permease n=2 Tax=Haloarcula marismortui TaxID=2238 RepID=M0JNL8_9EURY|nr:MULTISPECIES: carbohydrate ABC transporter permease [Haloarcula]EMA10450.1 ABC transporter permease [Haloarcula californiae ATCC 33799]EMA10752.1 ABC transporter permease [Haloarcula sinaiiensis ATCC 33800]QUJ74597.1 carbohydrate ABC transporter permease [Haloarcula sinaiiensis ATCC 33800]
MTMAGHDRSSLRKVRLYGVLIGLLGLMMLPFYAMFSSTLKPESEIFAAPATLVPSDPSIQAYLQVWTQTDVLLWVGNSFIISVGTVVLTLLLAIPAAYSCARNDFVGKRTFLLSVLVVQMFAPVVLIVGLFDVITQMGLFNTYLAVIVPAAAFTLPFNVWMLYGYFKTIPVALEESARIDGASQLQILTKIVLPLTKPALVASVTYTFLYAWNRLLFVLTFLTDSAKYNIPRGVFSMVGALQTDWRMMLTVSVIGIIPLLILFAFLEEYIVAGMTAGAVKE